MKHTRNYFLSSLSLYGWSILYSNVTFTIVSTRTAADYQCKNHGSGATHWLLVIGAKNGEFSIYDPLSKNKEPIPLSAHGKVYAYRVLVNF